MGIQKIPRKRKAYAIVDNLLELIKFICDSPQGKTVDAIKAQFPNISQRTLYRYLSILSLKFPITSVKEDGVVVWKKISSEDRKVGTTSEPIFNLEEVYALKIAQKLLKTQFAGTIMEEWLDSLYRKIDRRISAKQQNILEQLSECYNVVPFGVKDYSTSSRFFPILIESITWLQKLKIKYQPSGDKKIHEYTIEPYALVNAKGGFYMVGRWSEKNEIRTFAVERIKDIEQIGPRHTYDIPEDFSVEKYFKGAFGVIASKPVLVKLKFEGLLKDYLKGRRWPGLKKLTEENGSLIMTLKIGITRELISWILSFGDHVEVLEPPELRAKVVEDLNKTLKKYH